MEIIREDSTHTYYNNDKALISVTQLLKKHGLSTDYSNVNNDILKAKAERGTIIHEELEDFVKNGIIGFTNELQLFIDKCKKDDIKPIKSEYIVYNDIIAGTIDVSGIISEFTFLGDYKTTASLNKEAVAWQLSLYEYLDGKIYDKLLCFHFHNDELKIVEIQRIPVEEIEKLIECEKNGEIYQKPTLELERIEIEKLYAVQNTLKKLDEEKQKLVETENAIKEIIMKKMQDNNIKSIDNDYFKITYIEPRIQESLDSVKIKAELPEIFEKYKKQTNYKASLRITLKE